MGFLSEEFTGTRILKHEEELVIIKHVGNLLALGNVILKLFENMFKKINKRFNVRTPFRGKYCLLLTTSVDTMLSKNSTGCKSQLF